MLESGLCVWFTGLSGSGKTTLANHLSEEFSALSLNTFLLDGDVLRGGLCSDLGMTSADRKENNRRARELDKLLVDNGSIVLASFISPHKLDRNKARELIGDSRFIEVHLSTPIETCRLRDPKGLYKQADQGLIRNMVGIDIPYEKPMSAELSIDTSKSTPQKSTQKLLSYLLQMINID